MEWRKTRFDFYEVSDEGLVKSIDRYVNSKGGSKRLAPGRILKFTEDEDGYYRVTISCDGKDYTVGVHKLVAEAFIPNPMNLPVVHHINGNNKDNKVSNLMWTTVGYNNSEEIARKRKSEAAYKRTDNKIKIIQYTLDGEYVATYQSSRQI